MRPTLIVLASLVAISTAGFGQSEPPRLRHATIGFTAQFRNRLWTPLTVDLENPGPAQMVVVTAEGQGYLSGQLISFSRPVWLPAHSYRRVEFPVRPDFRSENEPGKMKIEKVLTVKLTDGQRHVWGQLDALGSVLPEDAFFVLVADSRFSGYNFLKDGLVGATKRPVARTVTLPRDLPMRALDYQGVDALILGDLTGMELTPLQIRAIYEWVKSGGHLIVVPGPLPELAPLAALLPVSYFSADQVETISALAPGFHFSRNLQFARMIVRDGQVRRGTRERPLVATRREGLGRVTAVAFDAGAPHFAAWPGAADFGLDLLADSPQFFRYADLVLNRSEVAETILSGLAGIKVPERRTVLVYLAIVAGGIMAILLGFRLTRRPEWGWAVAVVLAVAGGAGAIVAANRWKAQPNPFLNELYVAVARSGSNTAEIQAALGLFSPGETTYAVTTRAAEVSLHGGHSALTPPEQFAVAYEDQLSLPSLRVRAQDVRLLVGRGLIQATESSPGPDRAVAGGMARAQVRIGADGLRLVVSNTTASVWEDSFFKYHRFVMPLGDLAAGTVWDQAGLREPADTFTARLVRDSQDELRSRLRALFFPDPIYNLESVFPFEQRRRLARYRGVELPPAVYGWTDEPRFPVAQVTPPVARRAVGLWALEAPVVFEGERLLLPRGVMPLRLGNKASATCERGEGCFAGTRAVVLVLEFGLPAGCPGLRAEEASFYVTFRGSAYRCEALAVPPGAAAGEEVAFRQCTPLAGGPVYRIPDPARFFDPARRRLVVALRITAGRPDQVGSEDFALGVNQWQARGCDLQLQGAVR